MRDIKEFENEWKETYEGYNRVRVSMNGSWAERHKTDFYYLNSHDIVGYEIVDEKTVKLIGTYGISLVVCVYDISSLL
jgi:hypothetical protein